MTADEESLTSHTSDQGARRQYAEAKEEESDRREAHKAKRAAEQEAKASGADV